jgi:hypothetical protein
MCVSTIYNNRDFCQNNFDFRVGVRVWVMMFNANFNNISVIHKKKHKKKNTKKTNEILIPLINGGYNKAHVDSQLINFRLMLLYRVKLLTY